MGVYVFRCLHGPYVKVGHHLVTPRRPNAYYRVAGRGFESVVHPEALDGRLYLEHLHLEGWYPRLTRRDEAAVHRQFREGAVGEFHRLEDLTSILQALDAQSPREPVSESARLAAVRWGRRQIRRARRRRRALG